MPRETLVMVITLPDRDRPKEFMAKAANLKGQYRFSAVPCRLSVSQQLRGYYHGHIVGVLEDELERNRQPLPLDNNGNPILSYHDFAHAMLKERCFKLPVFDKAGELKGHVTGSTKGLDVGSMLAFIDRCRVYLWDTCRLWTDDPDPEWRTKRRDPDPVDAAAPALGARR